MLFATMMLTVAAADRVALVFGLEEVRLFRKLLALMSNTKPVSKDYQVHNMAIANCWTRGAVEISRPDLQPDVLTGEVVTNPQPPVDRERGAKLLPLTERLREIVAASPNPTGVAVRDLSGRYGDQQVEVNGTFRPKAASVIKLWILTELLREVDCGTESLDDGVLVRPQDVVGGTGELQYERFPRWCRCTSWPDT